MGRPTTRFVVVSQNRHVYDVACPAPLEILPPDIETLSCCGSYEGMRFIRELIHVLDVEQFNWHIKEDAHYGQVFELDLDGVDFVEAEATAVDTYEIQDDMKTVRIQFEIPEERLESLDALMEEAGIKTRTELFNNGMTLLRWAIRQRREGRAIASIDFDSERFREMEMPIFENIKAAPKPQKAEATTPSTS